MMNIKKICKFLFLTVAIILVLPLYAFYLLLRLVGQRDSALAACSQCLSLIPGISGSYLRKAFYHLALESCSTDIYFGFSSLLSHYGTIIRSGVYIGPQCNIGKCSIGTNTLIGSGVHVLSGRHQHSHSLTNVSLSDQPNVFTAISIGKECWIGNGAIVMADVGEHSVIGAGAVVVNPIPAFSVAVGNPAKVVKSVNTPPQETTP